MPIAASKLRVLIATTNGPVEVLLLTEEDAAIGRCVACIGGTTETADIAAAYHAFVVRPTGIIESRFGHSCYRLDVSGRIDAGSSWQLGVLAAHGLLATERLAQENDTADAVLWATGSVRPVDLSVGGVSHVPEKIANSLERLKRERAAGRRVLLALPAANAAEISPTLASELAELGIETVALAHVQSLFDALAMKLPDSLGKAPVRAPRDLPVLARAAPPPKMLIGSAAALLMIVAGVAALWFYQGPARNSKEAGVPPPPAQLAVNILAPEAVPFITDREQATIRDVYLSAPDHKALALGYDTMGFAVAEADKAAAEAAALANCQRATDERTPPNGRLTPIRCHLYASGNLVVSSRPPTPPQPWIVRNPLIETPFTAQDVPLISEGTREQLEKGHAVRGRSKALAISASGDISGRAEEASVEQAVRRALEVCGNDAGVPCLLVEIDDKFVVPIPKLMKIAGIVSAGIITDVAPALRERVARRLANANPGWNAVAIGAAGNPGLKLGAESEQAAIDGSIEDCDTTDRECHVVAIGPFLVEPKPLPIQDLGAQDLRISIGDTLAKVKEVLSTSLEPRPYKSDTSQNTTMLHLTTKGVWVFFDRAGNVSMIRLDAPFAGEIGGVRIKDRREALLRERGEPLKLWDVGSDQAYLYALDEHTSVRYDVDKIGAVETIFLFSRI
jgi:hypothetical protein